MYLRCGNQILKSLPSPSSPFLRSASPLTPSLHFSLHCCFSLIGFNSAWGDSVIDRLREREKICFFHSAHSVSNLFFFLFTVPWALQLIASSKLNHQRPPPPPPAPPSSLLPSTPSHPTEPWPATAAWPDVKEKERQDKERWRTERGHLLRGMRSERMEERSQREHCRGKRGD